MAGYSKPRKERAVHQNLKRILRAEHPLELNEDVRIFCWYDRYVVIAEVPSRRPIVKIDPYEGIVSIYHHYDVNPRIEINVRWLLDCLNIPFDLEINEKRDAATLKRRSNVESPWVVEIQGFPPGLRNPRRLNNHWRKWYATNNPAKPGKGYARDDGISVLGMHTGDDPTGPGITESNKDIERWVRETRRKQTLIGYAEILEQKRKKRDEIALMVMKHYHPDQFK